MQQSVLLEPQVIENPQGTRGVFIPMPIWEHIKIQYPDINALSESLPEWEKEFIDSRLAAIAMHPEQLYSVDTLFDDV